MNHIKYLNKQSSPRIHALQIISRACARHGVPAAQGLRILKRRYPTLWNRLGTIPHAELLTQLDIILMHTIKPKLLPNPNNTNNQPDHFILTTNLMSPHTTHTTPAHTHTPPIIHFLRTQRRYNKRRYARVRAASRPSFWAGMTLSTLVTAGFWGASGHGLNWISTSPLIPDANFILLILYTIIGLRFFRLYQATSRARHREYNKSKRGWIHMLKNKYGQYLQW